MYAEYFDNLDSRLLQKAFYEIYEKVLDIPKNATENEVEELEMLLKKYDIYDDDLIYLFKDFQQINIIRELSISNHFKRNLDYKTTFAQLKKIIETETISQNIKRYIYYLLFEPALYLDDLVIDLKNNNFRSLENTLSDMITTGKVNIYDGYELCALAFICNVLNDFPHLLYKAEYKDAEYKEYIPDTDYNKRSYFFNMYISSIRSVNEKEAEDLSKYFEEIANNGKK